MKRDDDIVVWPGGCIIRDVAYTVYCAACDERLVVTFAQHSPSRWNQGTAADIAKHLREQDWHTRRGLWVCPSCSQEMKGGSKK